MSSAIPIQEVRASAYTIPTEQPESDGTIEWNVTTMVLVEVQAGSKTGLGYSYADATAGKLVDSLLADVIKGGNALDIATAHAAMAQQARNLGRPGIASTAISAVDNAFGI